MMIESALLIRSSAIIWIIKREKYSHIFSSCIFLKKGELRKEFVKKIR